MLYKIFMRHPIEGEYLVCIKADRLQPAVEKVKALNPFSSYTGNFFMEEWP